MTVREGLGEDAVRERERLAFVAGADWFREQAQRRIEDAATGVLDDSVIRVRESAVLAAANAAYPDPVEADLRTLEKKYGEEAVHRVIRRRMGF